MKHSSRYTEIIKLRKSVFVLDMSILMVLALGVASQFLVPLITPVFGIIAFFIFYKKLIKAAHVPCPKCEEPFGTSSKWPLGIGGNKCQNCGLEIHEQNKL